MFFEYLVFHLMMAVICGMVASSKSGSFFGYFLFGLLAWPVALVAAILKKPATSVSVPASHPHTPPGTAPSPAASAWAQSPAPVPAFAPTGLLGGLPARVDQGAGVSVMTTGGLVAYPGIDAASMAHPGGYTPFPPPPRPKTAREIALEGGLIEDGAAERRSHLVNVDAPSSVFGRSRADVIWRRITADAPLRLARVGSGIEASYLGEVIGETPPEHGWIGAMIDAQIPFTCRVIDVERGPDPARLPFVTIGVARIEGAADAPPAIRG
jgi:hypothetical protein